MPTLRVDDPVVTLDRVVLTVRFDLNDVRKDRILEAGVYLGTTLPPSGRLASGMPQFTQTSGSFAAVFDSLDLSTVHYYQAYLRIEGEGEIRSNFDSVATDAIRIATNYSLTKRRSDHLEIVQMFGFASGLRKDVPLDSFGHVWMSFDDPVDPPPIFDLSDALVACDSCFTSTRPVQQEPVNESKTYTDSARLDIAAYHYVRPYVVYNGTAVYGDPVEIFIGNFWRQTGTIPWPLTNAACFVIDDKAYILSGSRANQFYGAILTAAYYPGMIVCEQTDAGLLCEELFDSIPAVPRIDGSAFTLQGRGYFGSGRFDSTQILDDFWVFEPANLSWSQIDALELKVYDAVSFVVGDKAYIGTGNLGKTNITDFMPTGSICIFTPEGWILGGIPFEMAVSGAVSWTVGDRAFIGTGHVSNGVAPLTRATFQFDDAFDFQPLPNFNGPVRQSAVAFAVEGQSYLGTGSNDPEGVQPTYNDFWVFDKDQPELGWFQVENMGSELVCNAVSFVLGGKAYVVGGLRRGKLQNAQVSNLIWEYTPAKL